MTLLFYRSVKLTGRWVRQLSRDNGVHKRSVKCYKRSVEREKNLLMTLLAAMAFFYICWMPYGLVLLIDPLNVKPMLKKVIVNY